MRENPERIAWAVLVVSFSIFVALVVTTPLIVRWYVRNARVRHRVSLRVQRAPLSVVQGGRGRPVSVAEDSDNIPEGSSISTSNATSGRLVMRAPRAKGGSLVATAQIYDETGVVLLSARSPRFSSSPLPRHIALEVRTGRVRVNVPDNGERGTIVEVHTRHGTITLREGSYEIKVNTATEVTVRYGEASVVGDTRGTLSLGPQERALVDSGGMEGPLPAARNLLVDGDFQDPLGAGWQTYSEQTDPQQPPGRVSVVANEGQEVAEFYRNASNHAEVGIRQDISYDVRDFTSLELHVAVRIISQSILGFGGCGYLGSECPIIVRIDYEDIHGTDHGWLHGFYTGEPADDWPIHGWAERIQPRSWQPYSSGNLMEELSDAPPAFIKGVTIYASGHSFHAMVTEVELLAQE